MSKDQILEIINAVDDVLNLRLQKTEEKIQKRIDETHTATIAYIDEKFSDFMKIYDEQGATAEEEFKKVDSRLTKLEKKLAI